MCSIKKLESDMRSALKDGAQIKLSVLRMLISAVRMAGMETPAKELDDQTVLQVIRRQCKQRTDSIEQFTKGNRPDLASKEKEELAILEGYLPQQLTDEALTAAVREAIRITGATSRADVGKVMKAVMGKLNGAADGKRVNQVTLALLS